MIYEVFAVFDTAAGVFSRPVFVQSTGMMLRSFSDEVNRSAEDNPMNRHSDDFALFHLGQFDDGVARFELFTQPVRVVSARDVLVSS